MTTRLRRLAITEVALVPEGDNPGAAITIAKSRPETTTTPEPPVVPVPVNKTEETVMVFDLTKMPEEFRKAISDELARVAKEAADKAVTETTEKLKPAPVTPAIVLPEAVQKQMDLQAAEITKLRNELDATAETAAIAKAKVDFSAFSEAEVIGKSLHRLAKVDAELHGAVTKALAAAQAIAKKTGALTKANGIDGQAPADESPEAQLDRIAKAKVAATPGTSFAKAYEDTLNENPALYTAYAAASKVSVITAESTSESA